ncbi:uncharacterized protein LOC128888896 isoform X1 [Hylaeus anthracinus]|uniref:uncharacterized protein LOC128888896 isoform X1 n=1 Tax=Hylaeus anthracinus TaxID=313031 RepID=UPI0023BA26A0|nr:uncharacterized protein LOC128888896 isoform X1 [Hylaeus anthracinus]
MCDLPKYFKKEKEDEDKIDKRYLKSKVRKKRLALSAKRLSKTKKSRENRKKAAALGASQSTAAEPGTSSGTPYKVFIKTEHEIIDKFIEEADVAKNGEVLEEKHLNAEKKTITSVTEGNNLKISGEISSVTDIVKKTEEDAENSMDDDCNWMVEQAEPGQSENPISEGIDFADFAYVFEQIKNLQKHSSIGCGIEHFNIVGCQQYGLEKTYNVRCRICNHVERISCLRPSDASIDINNAAVSATMVTGGGYNQLEEVMSAMNVSCMTKRIFQKCHNDIIDAFEVAAQREMEDAGREEKESAITRGDVVPESGIPWMSVVADGS